MAASKHLAEHEPASPVPLIGRDELNLAEFPIALIAERQPKGKKTIYFQDQHGRLTVTGSDEYGLPNAVDTDVLVALLYLTKQRNNFTNVKVYFSRYELIHLLGWPDEGWSYRRLEESLNCWGGVWLLYDGCWWNNRLKCHTDMKMHIIDTIEIVKNKARGKVRVTGRDERPLSWFEWNKTFIESCQADNLRHLNLDEYFSLKSAVAKRLYRFLGKRFHVRHDWTFDLREIAFDRVGLSRELQRQRGQDQGEAPTGDQGTGGHRLPQTARPRRPLRAGRPGRVDDPAGPADPRPRRSTAVHPAGPPSAPPPPLVAELVDSRREAQGRRRPGRQASGGVYRGQDRAVRLGDDAGQASRRRSPPATWSNRSSMIITPIPISSPRPNATGGRETSGKPSGKPPRVAAGNRRKKLADGGSVAKKTPTGRA